MENKIIKQLAHICIHTNDLKKTEIFYCDILGLSKKFNFNKDGNLFGFYIDLGNKTFIEFFLNSEVTIQSSVIKHFALEVENIEQVIERLRENGIEVKDKTIGSDNSWQTWATDPNGVLIEFHQYTDKSSQLNGNDCIVNWK